MGQLATPVTLVERKRDTNYNGIDERQAVIQIRPSEHICKWSTATSRLRQNNQVPLAVDFGLPASLYTTRIHSGGIERFAGSDHMLLN